MKRIFILAIVAAAIAGVAILKSSQQETVSPVPQQTQGLPRLLDLGSKGCTACTAMEPVLDQLREKFNGQLQVDFIDVWEHEQVAADYGIEIIPMQILFDADGKEVYRHQGFISTRDVVAKFKELGVDLHAE